MNKASKPSRLDVWGDSMCGNTSTIRSRRKREASKKRRKLLKAND